MFSLGLLSLFSLLVVLIGAEFFLRWHYRDVYSTPDGKSFFFNRSAPLFASELNGYHLRGVNYSENNDGRYRIVVQGDSLTYGAGVYPMEKIFTNILEKLLQGDDYPGGVMVGNAGVSGHNFRNHVRYLNFIEDIHPDFVLYQWYVNDFDSSPDRKKLGTRRLIANKTVHIWLWKNSALYYLMQHRYGQFSKVVDKKPAYDDYLIDRFGDPESPFSQRAKKELDSLLDGYEKRGLDYGIVLFPSFSGDLAQYKLGFLHDRVLEECEARKIPCLDLRETYAGMEATKLWANVFDAHPGELAHQMAAQAIYDYFAPGWLVKAKKQDDVVSKVAVSATTGEKQ